MHLNLQSSESVVSDVKENREKKWPRGIMARSQKFGPFFLAVFFSVTRDGFSERGMTRSLPYFRL